MKESLNTAAWTYNEVTQPILYWPGYDLDIPEGTTVRVMMIVNAQNLSGTKRLTTHLEKSFGRDPSSNTITFGTPDLNEQKIGGITWILSAVQTGTRIVLNATGEAGESILWEVDADFYYSRPIGG